MAEAHEEPGWDGLLTAVMKSRPMVVGGIVTSVGGAAWAWWQTNLTEGYPLKVTGLGSPDARALGAWLVALLMLWLALLLIATLSTAAVREGRLVVGGANLASAHLGKTLLMVAQVQGGRLVSKIMDSSDDTYPEHEAALDVAAWHYGLHNIVFTVLGPGPAGRLNEAPPVQPRFFAPKHSRKSAAGKAKMLARLDSSMKRLNQMAEDCANGRLEMTSPDTWIGAATGDLARPMPIADQPPGPVP